MSPWPWSATAADRSRSGLCFEIRYQGGAISPTKWLARR